MSTWPLYPTIYEINSWVWLGILSEKYKRAVDFATVPEEEWDSLASYRFDAIWFMGVWQRSPVGIKISMQNKELIESFHRTLPDFTAKDNVGSPYCVRGYSVNPHLGGTKGLKVARKALAKRGMRLILDFVPNHVAPDHPWVQTHPEYFILGSADDVKNNPSAFIEIGKTVFARGRDPYSLPWPDVLQLNAFHAGLKGAAIETILEISEQCDGVRCDMAMLMLNTVFERTWGKRAGIKPTEEYWQSVIAAIKKRHSDFKFFAESYWDLEWQLQQQGFDFCYDKRLYDRMAHNNAESIRLHLTADLSYQQKLVRFIENHDELRAAAVFTPEAKERAAALAILTLPGARLFYEGQFAGLKIKLPVFLARRRAEPVNADLLAFYKRLFQETQNEIFKSGNWLLCESNGWPDNLSHLNILVWSWTKDKQRYLIVINFSGFTSQALVKLPWNDLQGNLWRFKDTLANELYDRNGNDIQNAGLYVARGPWMFHFFEVTGL